jgi:hypothetical protein
MSQKHLRRIAALQDALRSLLDYTGGWDMTDPTHPIVAARTVLQNEPPAKFRDLNIGDTFDFIKPNSLRNSFTKRCTKISARKYRDDLHTHLVGTINVEVYNVTRKVQS